MNLRAKSSERSLFKMCICVLFFSSGAMQTPEAGADSTSTVPLQTTVPVQPTGSSQQVPVQQQVRLELQPALLFQPSASSHSNPNNCVPLCTCTLARPRLFNRFSMFTQHRCSMWRKTAASTPMETCESMCFSALISQHSRSTGANKWPQPVPSSRRRPCHQHMMLLLGVRARVLLFN